ncbi:MAG: hypothetical protein R3F44_09405 [Candidatus Competibacteraceae bacterium]
MGGLSRNSLAARLCDRCRIIGGAVWWEQVDELALLRVLGDKLDDAEAITRLNEPGLSLKARLQRLLRETLATVRCCSCSTISSTAWSGARRATSA